MHGWAEKDLGYTCMSTTYVFAQKQVEGWWGNWYFFIGT